MNLESFCHKLTLHLGLFVNFKLLKFAATTSTGQADKHWLLHSFAQNKNKTDSLCQGMLAKPARLVYPNGLAWSAQGDGLFFLFLLMFDFLGFHRAIQLTTSNFSTILTKRETNVSTTRKKHTDLNTASSNFNALAHRPSHANTDKRKKKNLPNENALKYL